MCNDDDLPPPPPAPSTPVMTNPMPSMSINGSGLNGNQTGTNATVVPSTPQIGTTTTPADCGKGSINIPLGMIIVLAVVFQLALKLI